MYHSFSMQTEEIPLGQHKNTEMVNPLIRRLQICQFPLGCLC